MLENYMIELGYTKEDIKEILNSYSLVNFKKETLLSKIQEMYNFLLSNGYSREEVIKMTRSFPAICGYSIENLKTKIEDMMELGYTREEVIKMTKTFPSIYALSIENLKKKIGFYDEINMHELAIIDAKQLMQSVDLSYARYEIYKEQGIIIGINNYKKLFINQKRFEK